MAIIKVGDSIPAVTLPNQIDDQVTQINIADRIAGKKAVIFGMPGAYTSICSSAHLPSLVRTADGFRAKGVEELIVVVVNDCRITEHWGRTTGATEKGITILADWQSELTLALGLEFSNPGIGFKDRTQRCAIYTEDGVVKLFQLETETGVCQMTSGETLLAAI